MTTVIGFQCAECNRRFQVTEVSFVCPVCSGNLEVLYDYDQIANQLTKTSLAADPNPTMWRYRPLLPIEPTSPLPPLAIGWTPLYNSSRLAAELGVRELWLKDDGRNPTASFKDRPSALAAVKAIESKARVMTTASSGNAGSALAGICASMSLSSVIFVPSSAPQPKIAQLQVHGATVLLIEGSYDEAFTLCINAANRFGWYQRSTGYNPYTREGKKTAALEIAEQLNWEVPDKIFVAVGDGNIISGLWKGFRDLQALGFISGPPRLVGVQAQGASALVDAVLGDGVVRPVEANTIADSINVGKPNDGTLAVRAIRESGGTGVSVSDDEILAAMIRLARATGVFAEPAAAAAFAGLLKQSEANAISPDERVLVLITGSGLKDIGSAQRALKPPIRIKPDMDELVRALPPELCGL
jgi:threonine synthase